MKKTTLFWLKTLRRRIGRTVTAEKQESYRSSPGQVYKNAYSNLGIVHLRKAYLSPFDNIGFLILIQLS